MTIGSSKGLITLISRFKVFNKGVSQSDSIQMQEQKTVEKRKKSNHIRQFSQLVGWLEEIIVF